LHTADSGETWVIQEVPVDTAWGWVSFVRQLVDWRVAVALQVLPVTIQPCGAVIGMLATTRTTKRLSIQGRAFPK
jgi:hypothetical protein